MNQPKPSSSRSFLFKLKIWRRMNANAIINDEMTLTEKLAAIDAAMANAQAEANKNSGSNVAAPLDPADLTMCEGCQ